jgi:hypothetical protein
VGFADAAQPPFAAVAQRVANDWTLPSVGRARTGGINPPARQQLLSALRAFLGKVPVEN